MSQFPRALVVQRRLLIRHLNVATKGAQPSSTRHMGPDNRSILVATGVYYVRILALVSSLASIRCIICLPACGVAECL